MSTTWSRRDVLKAVGLTTAAGAGLAACAPAEPEGGGAGGSGGAFHGAWPYQPAPEGHFNYAAQPYAGVPTVILGDGPYRDLLLPPSALWLWAEEQWEYLIADSHELDAEGGTLTVTLKEGLTWSDGSPLTSQDYLTTFYVQFIQRAPSWGFITGLEAPDDTTVVISFEDPPAVLERYVLKSNILSTAQYGEWADRAKAIVDAGGTMDEGDGEALGTEFQSFAPESLVVSGPYDFDYDTITNTQLTLVRNESGFGADAVTFDQVVIYNGETTEITSLVQSGDVDYATHGFAPASEDPFEAAGYTILRPPVYSGPALYLNQDRYPEFADVRTRKAFAYLIDRATVGQVSLAESGVAVENMVGFSDNFVDQWLTEEVKGKIDPYAQDEEKATSLLEEAGWTKSGDTWKTPEGEDASYEIQFPQTYADWSAAGKNVAEQLTAFGISVTARGLDDKQAPIDIDKGDFEMAIQAWGSSAHPHPHFSFVTDLFVHNIPIAKNQGGKGYGFPLQDVETSAGTVDLEALVTQSGEGLDQEEQKQNVSTVALAFNELLPIIPLFERYGNNPALEGVRVQGFPAEDDPILENAPYADNFVILKMYRGEITPVEG
ncbi:ABC transporter substrate-binding protein [Brachybacterium saurashtrense]|uniref:ABC transporter substrate-binding protein n=1 Tax=Brachybacterium saurashtrense TaxID=556288 RepID=A0A345YQZ0_9MICO|nr:ABC transporter substrate-binding protein [Brachybacterium saurashtrense]AXK46342.1 ABC transporter substrate-binding protein [Brachybacterium saurashtrense]RRR24082.1 ABC transporter substrate-binding protein [Brachybacterium saurashtrense]